MKFKSEVTLLVTSIALFVIATFFYSYQTTTEAYMISQTITYPYRTLGLAFVGVGTIAMVLASISFSRKTRTCRQAPF
jgi:hypothetical protein